MKPMPHTARLALAGVLITVAATAGADDVPHHQAMELIEQGAIRNFHDLGTIALGLHTGATIEGTELEHEYGRYVYQVELRDVDGGEWDMHIDAATGEVHKNERDD